MLDYGILLDYFCKPKGSKGLSKHLAISYFLSHVHTDHVQGLRANWKNGTLYCSQDTLKLLEIMYGDELIKHVQVLAPYVWHDILSFKVALLPANHCFGSTMFVFNLGGKYVVYTGDYRLSKQILEWTGFPTRVDWLMFDSTFHDKNLKLPTMDESVQALENVVKHIEHNKRIYIHLHGLGVEHFVIAWINKFKRDVLIDVKSPTMNVSIRDRLKSDHKAHIIITDQRYEGIVIRPCCKWFVMHNCKDPWTFDTTHSIYRVWYSQHASYAENMKLIDRLKPTHTTECVEQI